MSTLTDASAVMVVHELISSAMRGNDDDSVWDIHSLMFSAHGLRGRPVSEKNTILFHVVWFLIV